MTVIYQLGPLTFECPGPFNATDIEDEFGASYAVKPVVGAAPNREFVGPDDTRKTLSGTLFPFFYNRHGYSNGLNEVEMLRTMTEGGESQLLVRGDGLNEGWWLVERYRQRSKHLSIQGIGREISYDVALVRSTQAASVDSVISLFRMLTA